MSQSEVEKALDEKTLETWKQPSQDRIKKMSERIMLRLVALDNTKAPELADFDLAA